MAVTIDGVGEINGVVLPTTGFGKVLQVVRATDGTLRSTTSTSYVDASLSVTITPQKDTSAILLLHTSQPDTRAAGNNFLLQITNAANTAITGAENVQIYDGGGRLIFGSMISAYDTPATTSETTYKIRFKSDDGALVQLNNHTQTGTFYAIEVSA